MLRNGLLRRVPLAALLIVTAFGVLKAGTTGKIAGKIVDAQTKESLVGVNVLIVGTSMGASSDVDGEYFILNIPPGAYELKASAVGYTSVTVGNIDVSVDQTTKIDFTLQSKTVELGDITVTATRPIVQRDLTSTVASVSGERLSKLPVEDVASVVNLQAGVVDGHFRGGRSNEVKYLIDGVAVNDVFSGSFSMQAEVNSIQEIQVLSGTFNAEYGEALSGVVNQVTKIAGETYTGELSAYTGDYISSRYGTFKSLSQDLPVGTYPAAPRSSPAFHNLSPNKLYNVQGSLSGPVPLTDNQVKFYLSGRKLYDEGYIYGRRIFNPKDSSNFNDPSHPYIGATGDGQYVPMNYQDRLSLQGKLSINVGSEKGITLSGFYQNQKYRDYDQAFQLNPDGDYRKFQKSFLGSATYTYIISDAYFMDLTGSVFTTDFKQYVYPDPIDPPTDSAGAATAFVDRNYVSPDRQRGGAGANAFLSGGTQNWHFNHNTQSVTGRVDITGQVTSTHQMKGGIEFQAHRLEYKDYQIHVDASNGYVPALPKWAAIDKPPFDFNFYTNHPTQFAAYIQDKIELSYLVVNVGLRYDYFQPDGNRLVYPDSIAVLDTLPLPYPLRYLAKAGTKSQFSPRIGISYPITDRGAVHISYGHFFQIPPFEFLYRNPNFRIPLNTDFPEFVGKVIGNADLQPQRTVMYEIGLQQELTPELGLTVTGYYKDIRNLLGLEIHIKNDFKKFGKYVNLDYGSVKGFTVALERRLVNGFGASVDYTYQVAKGDASDPNDAFNKAQASPPIDPNKVLVPLSWDRRHSLNATITVGNPSDLVASIIGRLGSGLPYTPALTNQRTGLENSDNMPSFYDVDLYITKNFALNGFRVSVFAKVYNLFDTANELNVFGDTGRAGYTLALTRSQQAPSGVNSLAQYYTRPDYFSAPRQVLIGATFGF
jgi:outer membrane receptor protein involved in Fe transport